MITQSKKLWSNPTPCSSFYIVRYAECDYYISLWAIVGGQLAFSFCTPSFDLDFQTVRLNYSETHDSNINPNYMGWPTVAPEHYEYDGLTGEAAIIKLVKDLAPAYTLQKIREKYVTESFGGELESRRFHDTENRTYLHCSVRLNGVVNVVTCSSRCYWGRCDDSMDFLDEKWQAAAKTLNILSGVNAYKPVLYAELSSENFSRYLEVMNTLI